MAIAPGMRIGKYELRRLLGQGGFGMVFVAHDTGLDRELAIKFLLPEHTGTPELLQRFFQEARSAAKIAHLGIVTVFECGQVEGTGTSDDGTAFIAMELLQGESLTDRLARVGRLQPEVAIEIARQVASALAAAHRAGIVHRDLKPDNIYLVPDPAAAIGERVKVLDFGIAKLADTPSQKGVQTRSMMVFGTPRYMSPEQCRSATSVDSRSDIYALGCILFELLCGRPPFDGEPGELIAKHQLAPAPTVISMRNEIAPVLDHAVTLMMAKQPEQRPPTMDDVVHLLEGCGGIAHAVPGTGGYQQLPAGMAPTMASMTPQPGSYPPPTGPRWQPPPRSAPYAQGTQPPPPYAQGTGGPATYAQGTAPRAPTAPAAPSRKLWPFLLVGAIVIGGGITAIVLATGGGKPDVVVKPIDAGAIVAVASDAGTHVAPIDAPVIAVAIDAAATVAVADAMLASPIDAAPADEATAKLRAECLELVAKRSWKELGECAARLDKAKDPGAVMFADAAKREVGNSKIFADLQAALRAGNLALARHSLEELNPESVYHADAQALLEAAGKKLVLADEHTAIALAKEGKCKELDALKAQAAKQSKEAGDAIRNIACTAHVDPPPKACDPGELVEKGSGELKNQQNTAALALFEQAIECSNKTHQPIEPSTMRLAFTASCKAKNATKAKQYWTQLGKIPQKNLRRLCVENGIDPE